MTTTTLPKVKFRSVPDTSQALRTLSEDGTDYQLVNKTRTTLKEGEDVVLISSDGIGFSGYVYGFERLDNGGMLTYITLD